MKPEAVAPIAGLEQSRDRPYFIQARGRAFDVQARGDGAETEIDLYDEIGFWGVDAATFRDHLKAAEGGPVRLRINSPGGDVWDGLAMFNDLLVHPSKVTVEISGVVASVASIVAMAGDEIVIAENAFLMIHNSWTVAMGDAAQLEHVAGVLGQVDSALADTYSIRAEMDRDAIVTMMAEETWLQGPEAVEAGLADAVSALPEPAARFDLSAFRKAPAALKRPLGGGAAGGSTIRDIERMLTRDAGLSRSQARSLLRSGYHQATAMQDAGAARFSAAFGPLLQKLKDEV